MTLGVFQLIRMDYFLNVVQLKTCRQDAGRS